MYGVRILFIKRLPHKKIKSNKGLFTNYVDKMLAFSDHLPSIPYVYIFYGINLDKTWTFLNQLPTLSCKRSLCP